MMDTTEIKNIFTYHQPKDGQVERYQALRDKAAELANLVNVNCPDSREKSLAFTSLQSVVMWANAAIAIHE